MLKRIVIAAPAWLVPLAALAEVSNVQGFLAVLFDILNQYIIPLVIGVGVIYFLWGIIQYITAAGDEEKRTAGHNTMIYGIIGIFVMVSVWGFVNILQNTFVGVGNPSRPGLPG